LRDLKVQTLGGTTTEFDKYDLGSSRTLVKCLRGAHENLLHLMPSDWVHSTPKAVDGTAYMHDCGYRGTTVQLQVIVPGGLRVPPKTSIRY